jgi:hypothetical protein
MSTKERLAAALEAEGLGLYAVTHKARRGCYDDFESESATPAIDLVNDLIACGRPDLAERAMAGEWDATKEEAEAWANRQTDPEMRAVIDAIRNKPS